MRVNFSFSLTDPRLIEQVRTFKENGGNMSALIAKLLDNYFNGNIQLNNFNKELIKVRELHNELLEYRAKLEEWEKRIYELEEVFLKMQEQQKIQEELPLIRELRYSVFDDLDKEGFELFDERCRKLGGDPRQAINARLQAWAAKKQISMPDAIRLFCKAFPEIKVFEEEVVV